VVIKMVLSLVLRSCQFELVGDMSDADYRKQAGTPNPGTPYSFPSLFGPRFRVLVGCDSHHRFRSFVLSFIRCGPDTRRAHHLGQVQAEGVSGGKHSNVFFGSQAHEKKVTSA
jgi:hypothetical protein